MRYQPFILFSQLLCIFLGLVLLLGPREWFPEFYHPTYFGIVLFVSAFLVELPRLVLKNQSPEKQRLVSELQSIIAFSLLVNIFGELGLYQLYRFGFEYDKFAHFLVSMLFAFMLAEMLFFWKGWAIRKIILVVVGALFLAGLVWEGWEMLSDVLFETKEWGVYGAYQIPDTLKDICFNTLGIVAGLLVFCLPSKRRVWEE